MALATANEVMTQVPWSGDTPRSPAIAGIDTLAIDVSSTFMKVASDSAIVPNTSAPPVSGAVDGFVAAVTRALTVPGAALFGAAALPGELVPEGRLIVAMTMSHEAAVTSRYEGVHSR